jgi:hypothetical protein
MTTEFPKKFPRCIANSNEYFNTDDAIKHLHELYPGRSDNEILDWLNTFKDNKKLYPRIMDIVVKLTKQKIDSIIRYSKTPTRKNKRPKPYNYYPGD